jgi:hypothetical protein
MSCVIIIRLFEGHFFCGCKNAGANNHFRAFLTSDVFIQDVGRRTSDKTTPTLKRGVHPERKTMTCLKDIL